MGFFDELGKKASNVYKGAADKTSRIAKESKLKSKINQDKSEIEKIYSEIGKKVYEKHVKDEEIDIKIELEEECTKIDVLTAEIETLLNDILECKNRKKCPKCYTEIEKDAKFCPTCGEKQEEIQELNDIEIKEDSETKVVEKIVESNIEENIEENLEKTIEVESNINTENHENEE